MSYNPKMYQCRSEQCGFEEMDHFEFHEHVAQIHYRREDELAFAHRCAKCKEPFATTYLAIKHVERNTGHSFTTTRINLVREKRICLGQLCDFIMDLRIISLEDFQRAALLKRDHQAATPKSPSAGPSRVRQTRSRSKARQQPQAVRVQPSRPSQPAALTRAPIYGEEAHSSREQNLEDRADRRNREISPARTAPRSGLRGQSDSLPQSLTSEGPPSSPEDQSNTDIVFRSEVLHEVWNDEIGVPHRPERTRPQSRASTPVNRWANTGIKSDDAPNLVCSLGIMVDPSKRCRSPSIRATGRNRTNSRNRSRSPSTSRTNTRRSGSRASSPSTVQIQRNRSRSPAGQASSARNPSLFPASVQTSLPRFERSSPPEKRRQQSEPQQKRCGTESEETSAKKARTTAGITQANLSNSYRPQSNFSGSTGRSVAQPRREERSQNIFPPVTNPSYRGTVRSRHGSSWTSRNPFSVEVPPPSQLIEVPGFGTDPQLELSAISGHTVHLARAPAPQQSSSSGRRPLVNPTHKIAQALTNPSHQPTMVTNLSSSRVFTTPDAVNNGVDAFLTKVTRQPPPRNTAQSNRGRPGYRQ